ncbi:MAG: nuclear transport factor 2 family protein, partial [Pseudohongiellaceae bacterium]
FDKCAFRFHSTIVNDTDVFMTWTMFLNHPKLSGGETVRVEGASYLRTRNGKVYYHRDYFDLGAMLYENVPLLGRVIRKLKSRLGQ